MGEKSIYHSPWCHNQNPIVTLYIILLSLLSYYSNFLWKHINFVFSEKLWEKNNPTWVGDEYFDLGFGKPRPWQKYSPLGWDILNQHDYSWWILLILHVRGKIMPPFWSTIWHIFWRIWFSILSPVLHEPSSTNSKAQTHAPFTHTDCVSLLHPEQFTKSCQKNMFRHQKMETNFMKTSDLNTKVKKMVVNNLSKICLLALVSLPVNFALKDDYGL